MEVPGQTLVRESGVQESRGLALPEDGPSGGLEVPGRDGRSRPQSRELWLTPPVRGTVRVPEEDIEDGRGCYDVPGRDHPEPLITQNRGQLVVRRRTKTFLGPDGVAGGRRRDPKD